MKTAREIFKESIEQLKKGYVGLGPFYTERDIVWTIQILLKKLIKEKNLKYRVFNDYPILKGEKRSLSADIVILNENDEIEIAIEFKYEPSHERKEYLDKIKKRGHLPKNKFNVVEWAGVIKDINRAKDFIDKNKKDFVEENKPKIACAILIDEGGHFKERKIHEKGEWENFETKCEKSGKDKTSYILWTQFKRKK